MVENYEELLSRALKKLSKTTTKHERFKIPEPDVFVEGKTTVLRNFEDITDVIRRDKDQVLAYLLRELGTAGSLDGRRVRFKGRVGSKQIEERVQSYVDNYVLCRECNRPDTCIVKEGRILMLECEACGARRPITVRRRRKREEPTVAIEEGKTYELMIEGMGGKGDGIARKDKFIIYVPGTVKDSVVKVKIEKVSGTVCFGRVVKE